MVRAPEIFGDIWLNSNPLTKEDLGGKVVLYDFWTYSCVNCVRTLPYLRDWWEKYKNKGLVIVGIHTPEFEFEKDPKNVEQAIKDHDVKWPVVLDNDYKNWNAFANRFWPAKYLVNKDGQIVYHHFGEGNYQETENKIRELLGLDNNSGEDLSLPEHAHGSVCFVPTPETYCGYARGELSNRERYQPDKEYEYKKPEKFRDGTIGLSGKFLAGKEYVESRAPDAELLLQFHATEVNLVLHPTEDSALVEVSFTGKSDAPPNQMYGKDVLKDGTVKIEKPTLYNLLRSNALMDGLLTIRAKEGSFKAYAFTFSGCEHN